MYRPSPVRNQRSKGIKIKHVLQVCLLVAVCFWLIFQVKRSHDKKQEFNASDPKISSSTHSQSSDEIIKFGRKDLQPKLEETTKEVEVHEEVEEQEEHEDNKHEVEDQDEEKIEDEKEDERGGADDEIDENEQEKVEVEIDRDEMNTMDEDKETEESEEKENEEEKDGQNQTENNGSLDDHDENGSTVHTHEAREEHYKADDASSAVTNENGNVTSDNSNGNVGLLDNDQTAKNGPPSNTTESIDAHENGPPSNTTESIDAHENGPPSNTTVTTTESTQAQNVTEGVTDYISEVLKSNESNRSKTEVENDAGEGENLEIKNETEGTEESLDSYETKPEDLDQNETIDSGDPSHLEEKEVRTDLETLPEIETEGGNSEDTAAE